jgi:hypothetical protein
MRDPLSLRVCPGAQPLYEMQPLRAAAEVAIQRSFLSITIRGDRPDIPLHYQGRARRRGARDPEQLRHARGERHYLAR